MAKKKKSVSKPKNSFFSAASLAAELGDKKRASFEEVPNVNDSSFASIHPRPISPASSGKAKGAKTKKAKPKAKPQKKVLSLVDIVKRPEAPELGSGTVVVRKTESRVSLPDGGTKSSGAAPSGGSIEILGGALMVLIVLEIVAIIVLLLMTFL